MPQDYLNFSFGPLEIAIASAADVIRGIVKLDQAKFGHRWRLHAADFGVDAAFSEKAGASATTITIGYLPSAGAASSAFVALGSAVTQPTASAANATGNLTVRATAKITISEPNVTIPDDAVLCWKYVNGDTNTAGPAGLHGTITLIPAI